MEKIYLKIFKLLLEFSACQDSDSKKIMIFFQKPSPSKKLLIEIFPGAVKQVVLRKHEFECRDMSNLEALLAISDISMPIGEKKSILFQSHSTVQEKIPDFDLD